jgi:hypothetical protein
VRRGVEEVLRVGHVADDLAKGADALDGPEVVALGGIFSAARSRMSFHLTVGEVGGAAEQAAFYRGGRGGRGDCRCRGAAEATCSTCRRPGSIASCKCAAMATQRSVHVARY